MFTDRFNPELTQILNRVYGANVTAGTHREESLIAASQSRVRRQRDAEALEEALDGLRQLRERSQGQPGLKEEIDYLRDQIATLRSLGDEIVRLRAELAGPGAGEAAGPRVWPAAAVPSLNASSH